jgi:hypothetical protein
MFLFCTVGAVAFSKTTTLVERQDWPEDHGREAILNRSLRELRFCFLVAFPLLCAVRAIERFGTFVTQPMDAQRAIFGRVVTYPWQLKQADSWISEDGVSKGWEFEMAAFPPPLPQCKTDDGPSGNSSRGEPSCYVNWEGGTLAAGWMNGMMWMWFDPSHHDPDLAAGDNQ